MGVTRKWLLAMGIESDKVDEIIEAHRNVVDEIKDERDKYKDEALTLKGSADKVPELEKEIKELKDAQSGVNVYETKYNEMKEAHDKLKGEFDKYKADINAEKVKTSKTSAYRELLKKANISDKRIDKILKVTDIDKIEFDKDGKLKDEEALNKSIQEEWGDFVVTEKQIGATTTTPPSNNAKPPRSESRAAKIAAQYHANLYGESPKEVTQ